MLEQVIAFWYLSVVAVAAGLGVLALRNPIHAALALVTVIFHVAGLFVVLGAGFLAAIQVIVYAGAIVVLFLFTLMMLDMRGVRHERFIHGQIWLGIPLAILLAVEAVFVGIGSPAINQDIQGAFPPATVADLGGSTQALAAVLFSEYLLPFEVASVLLLVGAVGAIILARRYERVELEELDAGTARPSAAPITDGADGADQPTEHAVERGG